MSVQKSNVELSKQPDKERFMGSEVTKQTVARARRDSCLKQTQLLMTTKLDFKVYLQVKTTYTTITNIVFEC